MWRTPCPGCHALFSSHALALHLAQTTNPICRAVYEQENVYLPGATLQEPYINDAANSDDSEPESDGSRTPSSSQIFQGDAFGDDY